MLNLEQQQFIKDYYPFKGKLWCAERLGLKESQIRIFVILQVRLINGLKGYNLKLKNQK